METKKFTQFGTFSVIFLFLFLILCNVMFFKSGFNDLEVIIIQSFIILIFIICLLIFYKLTIYIDTSNISFKLGIGLIHKKYPLNDIASCRPVKNSALYGIGIRLTPDGWLYNVSGLYAIELSFKSRKGKIRIGTNKPEEVSQAINKIIEKQDSGFEYETTRKSNYLIFWISLIIALIIPIMLIVYGNQETKLSITNSDLRIKGIYGLTLNYEDITQIDTLSCWPRIKIKTKGYAFGKTLKGNFKLYDNSKVKLFIKKGITPYIFIKTKNTSLYLNFRDTNMTKDVFNKLTTNWKNKI